eukprot:scaffold543107_cov48-Prasinocladus_malaysianus.AAC.1
MSTAGSRSLLEASSRQVSPFSWPSEARVLRRVASSLWWLPNPFSFKPPLVVATSSAPKKDRA